MTYLSITRGGRSLRCGYTTGSCAAGAARAAAEMLLTQKRVESVELDTPKGIRLSLGIRDITIASNCTRCAVRKDSGDDPDITDGILVYATASKTPSGISIDGGEGVGRVCRDGLDQPVGAAAINSAPRRMIAEQVAGVCKKLGYEGGIDIVISIPGGAELARKTFNPRLGIEGGLSVIGSTGIVEPMSSAALVESIRLELRVLAAAGARSVLLCPGNYGEAFAKDVLGLDAGAPVSVGNYIGDAIDAALEAGFRRILLVGHIGKLVKLGINLSNTHSAHGDGRMETLIACALEAGGKLPLLRTILRCATTDAALDALDGAGLLEASMAVLGRRIRENLERRVPEGAEIGFICFTNAKGRSGVLAESPNARRLAGEWQAETAERRPQSTHGDPGGR